jgi:hypothetical protein
MPAPVDGMDAGTASQLIPGVGPTMGWREAWMESDYLMRLEVQFRGLGDAELRRITTLERDQFRDEALRLAESELARRGLPLLPPEEYWSQYRDEWLAQIGYCYDCWAMTTSEPLPGATINRLFGMRLQLEGEPCLICGSVLAANCFCILIPILRYAKYRALVDRRLYGDPPKTRRVREASNAVQPIAP